MWAEDGKKVIYRRTPESAAMLANVKRAMAITAALNRRLRFDDGGEIRSAEYAGGRKTGGAFVR